MARIRYLKPEFFTDEDLAEFPIWVRYLFSGLWGHADRDGRLEYRPRFLKGQIFPYDDVKIEDGLNLLSNQKQNGGKPFITVYRVEGKIYIQINNFKKHQKFHVAEKPKGYPPPPPTQHPTSTVQAPYEHDAKSPLTLTLTLTGNGVRGTGNGELGTGTLTDPNRQKTDAPPLPLEGGKVAPTPEQLQEELKRRRREAGYEEEQPPPKKGPVHVIR